MAMPEIDWYSLTDEEVNQIVLDGYTEQNRRLSLIYIPEQMAELNQEYLNASGISEGEPWVQPTGAHDAYPKDWIVSHGGKDWLSLVDANVWEPGVANWAVGDGEEWPVWIQPTGAHDTYATGAKVSHLELHWVSSVDNNSWEPGVYGWTEDEG